jgi:NADH-quinone oxidoreductase subunit K
MQFFNGTELVGINEFIIVSAILFSIGFFGVLINRKSLISVLISIEVMLLAVNINFVAFSAYLQDLTGQIFSIFILTVAAAEAAIGLAILIVYVRNKGNIMLSDMNRMKG